MRDSTASFRWLQPKQTACGSLPNVQLVPAVQQLVWPNAQKRNLKSVVFFIDAGLMSLFGKCMAGNSGGKMVRKVVGQNGNLGSKAAGKSAADIDGRGTNAAVAVREYYFKKVN